MRISIHIATYSVRPAHALPSLPHGIHGLVGSADRKLVSRFGELGVCRNMHFFARAHMACQWGAAATRKKTVGGVPGAGVPRGFPWVVFGPCRSHRAWGGPPPMRQNAFRSGLVVSGNGSADITRPSAPPVPTQGTGGTPSDPRYAMQAAPRWQVPAGKPRGFVPKSTPNPSDYK